MHNSIRWKCVCAYDGEFFNGWQSQRDGNAIQDAIELRLKDIFKQNIRIHGSSRTDAGVHAKGQVFHFDTNNWQHGQEKLRLSINSKLPDSIQIISIEAVSKDFHARFSSKAKTYKYIMSIAPKTPFNRKYCLNISHLKNLNLHQMQLAANEFVGTYNFSAFAGKVITQENPVKSIYLSTININNENIIFKIQGSGFLYKMVRIIVNAIIYVATEKLTIANIQQMLKTQQKIKIIPPAPPSALFLEQIHYD